MSGTASSKNENVDVASQTLTEKVLTNIRNFFHQF